MGKLLLVLFAFILGGTFVGVDFYLARKASIETTPDFRAYAAARTGGMSELLMSPRQDGFVVPKETTPPPAPTVGFGSSGGLSSDGCTFRAGVKVCSTAKP